MSYADLGRLVKESNPGQYDDIDDADLGRLAEESAEPGSYDDITGKAEATRLRAQAANIETGRTGGGFINGAKAFLGDAAAVGVNSAAGIADAAGGLWGLTTGDWDNSLRDLAKEGQEFADKNLASPEMRRSKQEVQEEIDAADGILGKAGAQIKGLATHSLAAADFAGTQAGQLLIPAAAGRVAGKIALAGARGATAATAAARAGVAATRTSVGVGAAIQGGSVGGGAYDELMSVPNGKWQENAEFSQRVSMGEDPEAVKQALATKYARMAGAAGSALSLAFNIGNAAQTTERVLAGAAREASESGTKTLGQKALAVGKDVAAEALYSEPGEEATGQVAQNMAVRKADKGRSLTEGVGEAIGGAVLGGAMGSGPFGFAEEFGGQKPLFSTSAPPKAPAQPSASALGQLEAPDPVTEQNLAAKRASLDADFGAVTQEKPHLSPIVDAWRKENPYEGVDAFEADVKAQEQVQAADAAMQHPTVQAAQQVAQQAQETLQAAQQVASTDPSQAPPGGLTPEEARDVLESGTGKLEQAAHAADENVRTQIQTVAKEQTKDSAADGVVEAVESAQAQATKDAVSILKESQAAMLAGSKPFDEESLVQQGIAAGLPEQAARDRAGTVRKKLEDKAKKDNERRGEGESGGSTPAEPPSATAASAAEEGVAAGVGNVGAAPSPVLHEAVTARGTRGQYRLRVVPLDSLISSDMDGYPSEVQPRDRSRHQANETVRRIGRELNPDLLMPTPSVTDGPPVVGPDSVVEGGNGRVMGMREAARKGSEGWIAYQKRVAEWATQNGVDASGIQNGVLVRERAFDVEDRAAFARELNESQTNSMDASSQARSDASRLTPQILGTIDIEAAGIRDMGDFLNAFIQSVPEGERTALRGPDGAPSQSAVLRAQAALFARAYGMNDSPAFREVLAGSVEETDPDGANILSGLRMGAPALCFIESVEGGNAFALGPEIMDAVAMVNDLRSRDVSLAEHLTIVENDMFGHRIPDEVVAIAKTVTSMVRSARKIGAVIRSYADIGAATMQGDMFQGIPTKLEAWIAAANKIGEVSREAVAAGEEVAPPPAAEAAQGGLDGAVELPGEPEGQDPSRPGSPREVASIGGVGNAILQIMRDGKDLPKDNIALKRFVAEIDGATPSVFRMKQAQEEFEAAAAMWAREQLSGAWMEPEQESADVIFARLLEAYQKQPNLNIRTSTSMENQAYSTPLPLSYLANLLAGMDQTSRVYEPTAGNGLLLLNVDPANVTVNELDPQRFERLRAQGFENARNGDALTANVDGLVVDGSQDAVIANPPFGPIFEDGQKVSKEVDGFVIKKIDHLIAARALDAMKPDGRATLILGASREAGGIQEADRIFFNWLYSRYHVVDHFEVEGAFTRQGTGAPVRVISIHGRVDSKNLSPEAGTVPRFSSWEDVHAHVRTVLDSEGFHRVPAPVAVQEGSGRLEADAGGGGAGPRGQSARPGGGNGGRGADGVAPAVPAVRGPARVDGRPAADPGGGGADGRGVQPPTPDRLEQVEGGEPDGGASRGAGAPGGPDVRGRPGDDVVARRIVETDANEAQTDYLPASRVTPADEGIKIPTNMAQANADAMTDLRNQVGDLNVYVKDELGYSSLEEVEDAFMGAQVDFVAAAIWNAKNGKAVIAADQTGIGKGRMAAAMIRWAIRNGKVPAFITVDPKLFTSMHEDLADIGTNDVKPMILNADASIYDKDGKTALVRGLSGNDRGKILDSGREGLAQVGANAIFATYSQFNKANRQQQLLNTIAEDLFVIMDESHNAAGAESNTGLFFKGIINRASGVTYLSATWAKRADNIGVYAKTDLGSLGMSSEELESAMVRGGYPLQTIISSALARAGQIFRRERSFKGVSFKTVTMKAKRAEHEVLNDQVTTCLRAIMDADRAFHDGHVAGMKPMKGQKIKDNAGNRASRSVSHTEFSSIVHNFIRQLSLALKVDEVANRAIEVVEAGGAPVIGLESTMGSFLSEYAAHNGLSYGDSLGNFGWKHILTRALDRTRYITIKDEKGRETQQHVPLEELDDVTRMFYRQAMDAIQALRIDLPASPIDWIRYRLQSAGIKVGEITGRQNYVDYSDPKNPKLTGRQDKKADQVKLVNDFRSGAVQAMILNVSGSTGISLHNDARWTDPKNPRPRTMLIAQPMGDINVFMQLLGRIFRTGQITPPSYEILTLDLPSEIRPTANLSRKMKGLNANTSSDTEGNTKIETVDILNQYGSQIVNEYLLENPGLAVRLHVRTSEIAEDGTGTVDPDFATKATGRLAVLPVAEQRRFWDEIIPRYNEHIDYLNSVGENKLVRRTLDLRAKPVSQEIIYPGAPGGGAFAGPAYLAQCEVRAEGKPMTPDEARAAIKENLGDTQDGTVHRTGLTHIAQSAFERYLGTLKEDGIAMAERVRGRFNQDPPPAIGQTVVVKTADGEVSGVVVNLESNSERGNPFAASKWKVTVATNSKSVRTLRIPLSKFRQTGFVVDMDVETALTVTRESTVRRFLAIGNILGAYRALGDGVEGEIITTTMENGETVDAIRLPSTFRPDTGLREEMDVNPEEAARVLARIAGTSRPVLVAKDGSVRASVNAKGDVLLQLEDKKRDTVMRVSKALGIEFANGSAVIPMSEAKDVLARMPFQAMRPALEEVGLLHKGEVRPEAFDRPMSFDAIRPEHISAAAKILGVEYHARHFEERLASWNRSAQEVADLSGRMDALASSLEDGSTSIAEARKLIRDLREKGAVAGSKLRTGDLEQVCSFLARASLAQKASIPEVQSKEIPPTVLYDGEVRKIASKLYPFIADPNGKEMRDALKYAVWCYEQKYGTGMNLNSPAGRREFYGYLTGEMKLQSAPGTAVAALAIGLLGAGFVVSPGLAGAMTAAIAGRYAMKLGRMAWDQWKTQHSPRTRIMAANSKSNVSGGEVVEMLDQVFLRSTEIAAPAQADLRQMQAAAGQLGIPLDEIGKALADHLEGAELPPELQELGAMADRIRSHFAKRLEQVGGRTIDNHFHRVYDFEGLQALKGDPAAMKAVAEQVRDQILQNDPERVAKAVDATGAPAEQAAYLLALDTLQAIYDGSDEAKAQKASRKAKERDAFILSLLDKGDGSSPSYAAFARIREVMKSGVRRYSAAGTKARKVTFQLPETVKLSNGSEVRLVDRDFFTVYPKYVTDMARSLAQKELLDPRKVNQFLNGIGPSDDAERSEIETFIDNDLWQRTERSFEGGMRTAAVALKNANSVRFLALNAWYPLRNLMFGSALTLGLTGPVPWMKAGWKLAKAMVPGIRRADVDQASVAGAIMQEIVDDHLHTAGRLGRWLTAPMLYSQQAVDVAGFYAGRYYAPKVLERAMREQAKGEHGEFSGLLREALGATRAAAVIEAGAFDSHDLDRFGLVYRNMISGTGRNLNLPKMLGTEMGKFLFQFSSIPAEQTRIFTTRIMGTKREAKYWAGGMFAGMVLVTAMWASAAMRSAGGDDDDAQKELEFYEAWNTPEGFGKIALYAAAQSGSFQKFGPAWGAFVQNPSGWSPKASDLALSMSSVGPSVTSAASAVAAVGGAWKGMTKAGMADETIPGILEAGAMPILRNLANDQNTLLRGFGIKVGKTDLEEDLSGR